MLRLVHAKSACSETSSSCACCDDTVSEFAFAARGYTLVLWPYSGLLGRACVDASDTPELARCSCSGEGPCPGGSSVAGCAAPPPTALPGPPGPPAAAVPWADVRSQCAQVRPMSARERRSLLMRHRLATSVALSRPSSACGGQAKGFGEHTASVHSQHDACRRKARVHCTA